MPRTSQVKSSSGSQSKPTIGYLESEFTEADNSNTVFIQHHGSAASTGMQNSGSANNLGMQNHGSSGSYGIQNHGSSSNGMLNSGSASNYGMQNHGSSGSHGIQNQGVLAMECLIAVVPVIMECLIMEAQAAM